MLSRKTTWCVFVYSILIVCLGYYGYQKTGSLPSLWASAGCGGILLLSSLAMFAGKRIGFYGALAMSTLLTGMFSYRYAATGKGLPAMLAVLSAALLLLLLLRLGHWRSQGSC